MNTKTIRLSLLICMLFLVAGTAEVVDPTAQPTPMATNTAQIVHTVEMVTKQRQQPNVFS